MKIKRSQPPTYCDLGKFEGTGGNKRSKEHFCFLVRSSPTGHPGMYTNMDYMNILHSADKY